MREGAICFLISYNIYLVYCFLAFFAYSLQANVDCCGSVIRLVGTMLLQGSSLNILVILKCKRSIMDPYDENNHDNCLRWRIISVYFGRGISS